MTMLAALLLLSAPQDDKLRIEGPPFLVFGDTIELKVASPVKDATVVWRLVEAPAGALETKPSIDSSTRILRGSTTLSLRSVGQTEGEIVFAVTLERKGVRLSTADLHLRVGPLIRLRAWCRVVENAQGGTRQPERIRDSAQRRELEAGVNRLLRPLGVEVSLEAGRTVAAPDSWFDKEGRFNPIVMKDGKKANSPSLNELLKNDDAAGLNLYFVRDCRWVTVQEGFERVVTEHGLLGIGLKDGQVVLDDGGDVASLAHEIGHAVGLDDLSDKGERGRLMYSVRRDRTGEAFTAGEMKDARERARRHLKAWSSLKPPAHRP